MQDALKQSRPSNNFPIDPAEQPAPARRVPAEVGKARPGGKRRLANWTTDAGAFSCSLSR
jgi:hypothetical protein